MKPFIYVHELLDKGGIWIGCDDEKAVRDAYCEGETGSEVIPLYRHQSDSVKDLIIDDLSATLTSLEVTLRAAGSIQFQCYHNDRDRLMATSFLRMADAARKSLDNKISLTLFD